jgi:hypothetical protein
MGSGIARIAPALAAVVAVLCSAQAALAQDPLLAPVSFYNWTGVYVGARPRRYFQILRALLSGITGLLKQSLGTMRRRCGRPSKGHREGRQTTTPLSHLLTR